MTSTGVRRDQSIEQLQHELDTLRNQLERNRTVLDVLYKISLACHGVTAFQYIFEAIYHELCRLFALDAC